MSVDCPRNCVVVVVLSKVMMRPTNCEFATDEGDTLDAITEVVVELDPTVQSTMPLVDRASLAADSVWSFISRTSDFMFPFELSAAGILVWILSVSD